MEIMVSKMVMSCFSLDGGDDDKDGEGGDDDDDSWRQLWSC